MHKGEIKLVVIIGLISFILFVLFSYFQYMVKCTHRKKHKNEEFDLQPIKTLAEDFINKTITLNKPELNNDDYKKFYELVKENNIKVENNYSTDVPYKIRSILYDAYVKNTMSS